MEASEYWQQGGAADSSASERLHLHPGDSYPFLDLVRAMQPGGWQWAGAV
jgi:hypothetical protein